MRKAILPTHTALKWITNSATNVNAITMHKTEWCNTIFNVSSKTAVKLDQWTKEPPQITKQPKCRIDKHRNICENVGKSAKERENYVDGTPTVMSSSVGDPVVSLKVWTPSCEHHDVLQVTPRQQATAVNNNLLIIDNCTTALITTYNSNTTYVITSQSLTD